jgi:MFS family permease
MRHRAARDRHLPQAGDRVAGSEPSPRTAWALGVTELTCWGAMIYTFSVFLPEMHQSLGWSQSLITAAYSFSIAVRAIAATAVGWWIDRRGAAVLMTAGAIGGALILVAWSAVSTPLELFAVFLGIGITTSAILYEPAFAIVVRTYTERRDSRLLIVTILGGFASTIFLPAAAALVAWLGWRHALDALAVIVLAGAALPLALFVRDPRGRGPGAHDHGDTATAGIRPAARMAAASRPYRWLTLASFLISISLVFVNVYLVSYLLGQGYTLTDAAAATGSLGILSVLGRIFLSQAAQRIGLARLTGTLVALQALAVIPLLGDARALPSLVGFILLFGAGFGVVTLARARLLVDYAPADMYARWAGFQATIVTVAQVLAPVTGSLLHAWAGYPAVFITGAAFSAAAAGSLFMAGRAARRTSPAEPVTS